MFTHFERLWLWYKSLIFSVHVYMCRYLPVLIKIPSVNCSSTLLPQYCPSSIPSGLDASQVNKNHQDVRGYVHQLNVVDNQRTLSQLSHKLEPRRTWDAATSRPALHPCCFTSTAKRTTTTSTKTTTTTITNSYSNYSLYTHQMTSILFLFCSPRTFASPRVTLVAQPYCISCMWFASRSVWYFISHYEDVFWLFGLYWCII